MHAQPRYFFSLLAGRTAAPRLLKAWHKNKLPARATPCHRRFCWQWSARLCGMAVPLMVVFHGLPRTREMLANQASHFVMPTHAASHKIRATSAPESVTCWPIRCWQHYCQASNHGSVAWTQFSCSSQNFEVSSAQRFCLTPFESLNNGRTFQRFRDHQMVDIHGPNSLYRRSAALANFAASTASASWNFVEQATRCNVEDWRQLRNSELRGPLRNRAVQWNKLQQVEQGCIKSQSSAENPIRVKEQWDVVPLNMVDVRLVPP